MTLENPTIVLSSKWSLLTGLSLLLMAILAGIGYSYGFSQVQAWASTHEISMSLKEVEHLLRLTLVCFIGIVLLDILVAWTLHQLFYSLFPLLTQLVAWIRLIYAAMLGVALFPLLDVFRMLDPVNDQLLVDAKLNSFLDAWSLGLIFFGIHLLLLGVLMKKTSVIPSAISYLMILAGLCYVVFHFCDVSFSSFQTYKASIEMVLAIPMAFGELVFAIYLIWIAYKQRKSINSK